MVLKSVCFAFSFERYSIFPVYKILGGQQLCLSSFKDVTPLSFGFKVSDKATSVIPIFVPLYTEYIFFPPVSFKILSLSLVFKYSAMTGKGQSSSQFPRRAVLKSVQTTGHLHSSPTLVSLCLKSSKLGFSITWTENFQMFKLGLEKAEEPEIKFSTFAGS